MESTIKTHLPRILITGVDRPHYVRAIQENGGIPTVGYTVGENEIFDGLILSGGVDVNPARYGEAVDGAETIDDARDEAEFAILKRFAAEGKPILGICRGEQLMNVFFGGSLIQHLPTVDLHRLDGGARFHEVAAEPDSKAERLWGTRFTVNSYHHEAVKEVAPEFRVTLRCVADGTVEAIEHQTRPWFAMQFHPELMLDQKPGVADGNPLFRYFLSLCR